MAGFIMNNGATTLVYFAVVFLIVIVAAGIYRGVKGQITIYRDYFDLGFTAGTFAMPVGLAWFGMYLGEPKLGIAVAILVFSIAIVIVVLRTFADNRNFLNTVHALITKSSLCLVFSLAIVEAFTGKNRPKRGAGALVALLIGPIMFALIKDRRDRDYAKILRRFGA